MNTKPKVEKTIEFTAWLMVALIAGMVATLHLLGMLEEIGDELEGKEE